MASLYPDRVDWDTAKSNIAFFPVKDLVSGSYHLVVMNFLIKDIIFYDSNFDRTLESYKDFRRKTLKSLISDHDSLISTDFPQTTESSDQPIYVLSAVGDLCLLEPFHLPFSRESIIFEVLLGKLFNQIIFN